MLKPRLLVISHSSISEDPRILRHIEVAQKEFEIETCSYGQAPTGVARHFEINAETRFLPRDFGSLIKIQLGKSVEVSKESRFTNEILELVKTRKYDAVLINDVHSLSAGFGVANNPRIWVDMHEYAPLEGEADWRWMLAFRRYATLLCDYYLAKATCVSTVSSGIAKRYAIESNRDILLIRNSHPFKPSGNHKDLISKSIETIRFVHVGAAMESRKLETLVQAFGLAGTSYELDLLLVPTSEKAYRSVQLEVDKLSNVRLVPPVSNSNVIDAICKYDVGIITIPPNSFNYLHGLPNKLFQYVQARLPVLSGPLPEIASVIDQHGIGWVSSGFTREQIATCISQLTRKEVIDIKGNLDKAAKELSADIDDLQRLNAVNMLLGKEL